LQTGNLSSNSDKESIHLNSSIYSVNETKPNDEAEEPKTVEMKIEGDERTSQIHRKITRHLGNPAKKASS